MTRYPLRFLAPALFAYLAFYIVPVIAGFGLSMTNWNIYAPLKFIGLDNFRYLFTYPNFKTALVNTLTFAGLTTVWKIVLGFALAMALSRSLYTKNLLRTVFYLPAVLGWIVIGIMFAAILEVDGILNRAIQVFLPAFEHDWVGSKQTALFSAVAADIWKWAGFNMAIFLAGLKAIPEDYYEAGSIDGASWTQRLTYITVPLLMPAFTINVTSNLIGGFKVFELIFVLTNGGPGYSSEVINTMVFRAFSEGLYGRASAIGLVLVVLTSIFALRGVTFFRKREVEL